MDQRNLDKCNIQIYSHSINCKTLGYFLKYNNKLIKLGLEPRSFNYPNRYMAILPVSFSPREKIEIQAAGTGTNKANQSDSTFDHTDWMLVVVLILVFLGLLFVIVKRIQKHMKKTVIHEIELHELRRSTMLLNTSSSSSRT